MTTVNDLYLSGQIQLFKGVFNILNCGVRTGKTYWAATHLIDYTRDGLYNRVLILTDTTALRNQIVEDYEECANADLFWAPGKTWGDTPNKIGVMCYQKFAYMLLDGLDFLDDLDVICWDECDAIFNFASSAFTRARKYDFARKDMTNSEVLAHIQAASTKPAYISLVLLGFWEKIIQHQNIYCIGLSATPERAISYYRVLTSASYKGKIDAGYRMKDEIYFTNILEHIKTLEPEPDHGYWCFSPYIEPNRGIVAAAARQGFNAIEIHSPNNVDKPMDEEQKRVYDSIIHTHTIPPPYDFVVVNNALKTGITITDRRFDRLIVNSFKSEDKEQAARMTFSYQKHQRIWLPQVPEEYLNKWMIMPECRRLATVMGVKDLDYKNNHESRILTWNKLKDMLPFAGYEIQGSKRRIDGKLVQCYMITGEWHDIDMADKEFEALVAAKVGEQAGA